MEMDFQILLDASHLLIRRINALTDSLMIHTGEYAEAKQRGDELGVRRAAYKFDRVFSRWLICQEGRKKCIRLIESTLHEEGMMSDGAEVDLSKKPDDRIIALLESFLKPSNEER